MSQSNWGSFEASDVEAARIQLELTMEQARAVSRALDLFTRMGLAQMSEIANMVRRGDIPFASGRADPDAMNLIDALCVSISRQLGFAPHASLGIGNERVPKAALRTYEVQKILDKVLAEHHNPSPDFRGVDYDGLAVRYTTDPEPVGRVIDVFNQR